ncbi:hypothetical protein Efla_006234 [Eimeria flavescens]
MQGGNLTAEGEAGPGGPPSSASQPSGVRTPQAASEGAPPQGEGGSGHREAGLPQHGFSGPLPSDSSSSSSASSSSIEGSFASTEAAAATAAAAAAAASPGRSSSGSSSSEDNDGDEDGSSSSSSSSSSAAAASLPLSSSLDSSLLLVPLERTAFLLKGGQKTLARDTSIIIAFLRRNLEQQLLAAQTPQQQLARIDFVLEKVQNIKRRPLSCVSLWVACMHAHPSHFAACMQAAFEPRAFSRRIDWSVFEYLGRNGFITTAREAAVSLQLQTWCDGAVYSEVAGVISRLQRGSTAEAFKWMETHSAKLRKLNSPLETAVQTQHAIFLLRQRAPKEAVNNKLAGLHGAARCGNIRRVLGLAALLDCPPPEYEYLFGEEQLRDVVGLFQKTSSAVLGMTADSLLSSLLLAGLSAVNCPSCLPELADVVQSLPMPHRLKSNLICPVVGEPMVSHS